MDGSMWVKARGAGGCVGVGNGKYINKNSSRVGTLTYLYMCTYIHIYLYMKPLGK